MRRLFLVLALLLLAAPAGVADEIKLGHYGMVPIYGRDVADGTYDVAVESSAPSFKIAKAVLTVTDGEMSAEMTLDGGEALQIPVPALNAPFDCAASGGRLLIDAAGLPPEALAFPLPDYALLERALLEKTGAPEAASAEPMALDLPDGAYSVEVNLAGGGGRASVSSPTLLTVRKGRAWARLIWSGSDCDFVRVGGVRYDDLDVGDGVSTFEIPVPVMDAPFPVIAHTAGGDPAEIDCQLTFYAGSIGDRSQVPQEAARQVLMVSLAIIIVGGALNYLVKKARRG